MPVEWFMGSRVCHRAAWLYCCEEVHDPLALFTILTDEGTPPETVKACLESLVEYTEEYRRCLEEAKLDARVKDPRRYCRKRYKYSQVLVDCDGFKDFLRTTGYILSCKCGREAWERGA